jgi:hypothetical protein
MMEWISVDERLPEETGHYLAWADTAGHGHFRRAVVHYSKRSERFTWVGLFADVTHWAPLLDPPETGQNQAEGGVDD